MRKSIVATSMDSELQDIYDQVVTCQRFAVSVVITRLAAVRLTDSGNVRCLHSNSRCGGQLANWCKCPYKLGDACGRYG